MAVMSWLLFLYSLPAKNGAVRLSLWRQLKRLGAVPLKTSAYILPDHADLYEKFQWLAQRIREQGGDATLIRAADVDGASDEELTALFQKARAVDYEEVLAAARPLLPHKGKRVPPSPDEVEKIVVKFQSVRLIDYFDCPKAADVEMMLRRLREGRPEGKTRVLSVKAYQNRTWLTRPQPEVDRVGSAWLIRRFVDPSAAFVFAASVADHPDAVPYDMVGVEFGHHGDDCTFETLIKRFSLEDAGLKKIAAIVHDADLGDGRHGTLEGAGLVAVFRGWALMGWSDQEILNRGFECFDGLHRQFSSSHRKPSRKP